MRLKGNSLCGEPSSSQNLAFLREREVGCRGEGLQEGRDRVEQGMLCPQRVDAVRLFPTPQLHRACAKFLLLPSVTGAGNRPRE